MAQMKLKSSASGLRQFTGVFSVASEFMRDRWQQFGMSLFFWCRRGSGRGEIAQDFITDHQRINIDAFENFICDAVGFRQQGHQEMIGSKVMSMAEGLGIFFCSFDHSLQTGR